VYIVYNENLGSSGSEFISLRKPAEFWSRRRPAAPAFDFRPVGQWDLCLIHDEGYVSGVLSGGQPNGFGTRDRRITDQILWANGAMCEAVRLALATRGGVCAPVSGFHHAGYDYGAGYCTFNGLILAIVKARKEGWLKPEDRVLIYDGDAHFGDGCADIIEKKGLGNIDYVGRSSGIDEKNPLEQLRTLAAGFVNYRLVVYQAGADAYVNDPYGSGYLTKAELEERDRTVFEACAKNRIPLAWCFAGGYDEKATLQLHLQSWAVSCDVYRRAGR
jgi:acetoin utilization deacetylase AcuC-like enzyme